MGWSVASGRILPLILLLISVVIAPVAEAAEGLQIEDLWELESAADVQVSPDGSQIIFTRRGSDKFKDVRTSALWLMKSDGSKKHFLLKGSSARWSPDSQRIAYIAPGPNGKPQIFTRWMDNQGATSQISKLTNPPKDITWSPDGRWIAFRMLVPSVVKWPIGMPNPPDGAKWTESPRIIDKLHNRQDRRGFNKPGFDHLFVIPVDGGSARQITSGAWHVGARYNGLDAGTGLSWTPDGKQILFAGLVDEDADLVFGEGYIYGANVETGEVTRITREKGYWFLPRVSPDGKHLAYSGMDFEHTNQSYKSRELWISRLDGSGRRLASGGLDGDVASLLWAKDSKGAYFAVAKRGYRQAYYTTISGSVRQLTQGGQLVSLNSLDRKGNVFGVVSTVDRPSDVIRLGSGKSPRITFLTDLNTSLLEARKLGSVEEINYSSNDGTGIQGWIVRPPSYDASQKYPLILVIHGGPHNMYTGAFNGFYQILAANGYVVLYTNPRGSTGYGTEFGNAISNAFPGLKDFEDLMAGVDAVVAQGNVDQRRLFVTGCSGGGALTAWTVAHTDRFAAAASLCPVTNWISLAGTMDIAGWGMRRFRPFFWEDPKPWLEHSPIMHVGKIKTPTLIMTGALDLRTPPGQSEQLYTALKIIGVPTRLLLFNKEWHSISTVPSNAARTPLYILDWFRQWDPTLASKEED